MEIMIVQEDKPPRIRSRFWLMCGVVFSGSLLLFAINNGPQVLRQPSVVWKRHLSLSHEPHIACHLPKLQPLSEEVSPHVSFPTNLKPCPNHDFPLLHSNNTHIWLDIDNLEHYNVTHKEKERLLCCYQPFYRPKDVEDVSSHFIDDRIHYEDCTHFTSYTSVRDEFVKVNCSVEGKKIYKQYFLFAPNKDITLYDDIKQASRNKSYNVIVLGIDNVSRMNFHRTMPRTLATLRRLGAVELTGYNKVADNSFPNLVPMLMGYSEAELQSICHPYTHRPFDECPFIWHAYKRAGYYTAMAEDSSYLGTFNYLLDGFLRQPTDYYAHPFIDQAHKNVGNNHDFNSFLCMNERYFFQVLVEYVEKVVNAVASTRLFGFFWEVTMSHDYVNYPMVMDGSYERLFRSLEARKYLEESIVLLVSDHGIRWGPLRATRQGRLEESLPFVFVLTPESFRNEYHEAFHNLQLNRDRLTTPYDVHETLMDLTNFNNINNSKILSRMNESYASNRGISLFLPIPKNRTCAKAGIGEPWCTCRRRHPIPQDIPEVRGLAESLIREVNAMLREHEKCATLSVAEVLRASELDENTNRTREISVAVRVMPGDGRFEGTLVEGKTSGSWKLAGAPSRLNLYGNQSYCVNDPHLKLYCYCV